MPARFSNSQAGSGNQNAKTTTQAQTKVAIAAEKTPAVVAEKNVTFQPELAKSFKEIVTHEDRAKFYTGHDRMGLQGSQVQRVRELQEENDNLQREINLKQKEMLECTDPLTILADIEHRKIMISRNTGEILKIYSRNEERIKRLSELDAQNSKMQKDMIAIQGRFIVSNDMEERTKIASEFFMLKSAIEKNIQEIEDLSRN